MNIIDYRFSKETNALIKNLIGKTLEVVAFDSLPNAATTAYGMVSIVVDGCRYCFSDFLESIEYINRTEDVAIFKFEKISDSDFASFLEERIPIVNTVNQNIHSIKILNENQQLYLNENLEFDIFTVRGIIIELADGREISFEKSIWFSEFITVKTGYDLINNFTPLSEFYEEWEDSQYIAKAERKIVLLKKK